jgi:plastocyanin
MRKIIIIILVVIVLGALIFLGFYFYNTNYNQSKVTSSSTPKSNMQTANVSITNFAFNPNQLMVKAGTEVTFNNNDSVTHTVTFDSFNSGNIAPGSSYNHTFSDKGTFNYHGSIHPNMTGAITVQ